MRTTPACFADWQESHATDRGCGNCNLRTECRTGESEYLVSIPYDTLNLMMFKANLELSQRVNKLLNAFEPTQPAKPTHAVHVDGVERQVWGSDGTVIFKDANGNVLAQFDSSAQIHSDYTKPSAFADAATTIDDRGSVTPSCTPLNWPKPEQEPVAIHQWRKKSDPNPNGPWYDDTSERAHYAHPDLEGRTVYTTPPQRKPLIDWISIADRLPDSGGYYLVTVATDDGPHVDILLFSAEEKNWLHDDEPTYCHGYYFEPTHWAHRPEPAKESTC